MAEHGNQPILELKDLHVRFDTQDGEVHAVKGISLAVSPGETLAIVGESGSGKSQSTMSIMGLLASNGKATGSAVFRDRELIGLSQSELNTVRGRKISMIFQEPMTSLDPLYAIERQIAEPLIRHQKLSRRAARARVLELLELVQIPDPKRRMRAYPHELSGGQRQRVMIAMALANEPEILIADEPTTALDVTIQADILVLLSQLQKRLGMAIIFITHDLGIVKSFADRVCVMRSGEIVETGPTNALFRSPRHDYTKMLLASEPEGTKPPPDDASPILLQGIDLNVTFDLGAKGMFSRERVTLTAVNHISITLRKGQTIGVVGESGSGKSTLGRALLQLLPMKGSVLFNGHNIETLDREAMRPLRKALQLIFQDPFGSLSPRMTVGEIISEGLLVHKPELNRAARDIAASQTLAEVDLDPVMRNRYPHEFSGGQRQRVAIARAMILKPSVVVLDEPTSALDRSVQKQIIKLLRDLQDTHDLSYLFISHDLAVVRAMSDHVIVMRNGQVVEEGPTEQIFAHPREIYTQDLMRAAFFHQQAG